MSPFQPPNLQMVLIPFPLLSLFLSVCFNCQPAVYDVHPALLVINVLFVLAYTLVIPPVVQLLLIK